MDLIGQKIRILVSGRNLQSPNAHFITGSVMEEEPQIMFSKEHHRNLPHYAIECGSSIALKVELRPLRSKDRGVLWDDDAQSGSSSGCQDGDYMGVGVSVDVQMSYQLNRPPPRMNAVKAMQRIVTRPLFTREATHRQGQHGSSFDAPIDISSDDETTNHDNNDDAVSHHIQPGSSYSMPIMLC